MSLKFNFRLAEANNSGKTQLYHFGDITVVRNFFTVYLVLPGGEYGVKKATKGVWWMPWHQETMKDVASCEKLRGVAKQTLIRGYPNGGTHSLGSTGR